LVEGLRIRIMTHRPLSAVLSIGPRLLQFQVDTDAATLAVRGALDLQDNVQYAWPHASGDFLYVAASNGGPGGTRNDRHFAHALALDPRTRALRLHGPPAPLPARPVHLTTDETSRHLLVAYNDPSGLTVHRIAPDATLADIIDRAAPADAGVYGHQVRVTPGDRTVILVTRGNSAVQGKPEDPGALKVFDWREGRLGSAVSVAPGGGYGFGPRHVDFHADLPWLFVSLERQNRLDVFPLDAHGHVAASPAHCVDTLADAAHVHRRQLAGAIHVHPNGRFVYVANRALGLAEAHGKQISIGGETTIAVFAIDAATGMPRRIQDVDTMGASPRTFAIDPSGRLMLVANSTAHGVLQNGQVVTTPANIAVLRIDDDGTLRYVRRYAFPEADAAMSWIGFVG
jgi:6-phosphogluconolactonase (cycloisomerase 2 family)